MSSTCNGFALTAEMPHVTHSRQSCTHVNVIDVSWREVGSERPSCVMFQACPGWSGEETPPYQRGPALQNQLPQAG